MNKYILIIFVLLIGAISTLISTIFNNTKIIRSANTEHIITDDDDWSMGSIDNISILAGVINIDNKTIDNSRIDLQSIYDEDPGSVIFDPDGIGDTFLSNNGKSWSYAFDPPESFEWIMDMGEEKQITSIGCTAEGPVEVMFSTDNVTWDYNYLPSCPCDEGDCFGTGAGNMDPAAIGRYMKVAHTCDYGCATPPCYCSIAEVSIYRSQATATHTSAATQLDSGVCDSSEWTTFVPDDTIPANTSIDYRFRTSADAATWGSWTASTPSAASIDISTLLGATDAAKRYLQVESTLANTDGVSTPTIAAYTTNYECTDLPAETCSDGIQNQDETGIDCGGTICDACPTCDDGIMNGDETGVDCGGSCDACVPDPTCSDGIQNQGEEDIDCGGPCDACPTCDDGIQNGDETGVDCGGSCDACVPDPTCSDGIQNQGEEDIDCGGPCDACPAEETCSDGIQNQDETGVDCGGSCPACETCSDGIKNQDEEDIDCGGTICDPCPTCDDGIQNGDETGVDCGGGGCPDCPITPEPPPPSPPGGCTNFSHLVISPSSLSICANDSAIITYYGVDTSGNIMSGLSEFLVVETGTLVGNRYTAPSQPGNYTMAASSICGNANGTITVRSCLPSPPPSPPPGPPPPGPPPPNCVGPDCECEGDICWCIGEDCTCSDPETCLPCVGEDCVCDPDTMVCHCEGDECVCNDPERCEEEPEPKKPLPVCIGPYCIDINDKIVVAAGSTSTVALGLAALVASLLLLMQGLANVLTMIRPSQIWAYLLKGRDKKRAKGLVYDASSGIGIPLVKVLLFRSRDQKLIRVATSGSDGRFALETPPGEEYFIQVKKEGYDALSGTQARISGMSLAYENNYFGGEFRADDTTLLFNQVIPMSPNEDSLRLALGSRTLETVTKVFRVLNIPLLIFGFMMSTLAMIESKTPYNLVIFYLYLLIFVYYLIKIFFIDGRSFGVVINQAKRETVDLAIVRAISETRGKLAKTTVTNEKGRYTLVLPKGFYKIVTSKPNLRQPAPLSVRVKGGLKPRTERIAMVETRAETNSNTEVRNLKPVSNSNTLRPAPYAPPITPGVQPPAPSPITPNFQLHTSISQPLASSSRRSFSDSGEIVERYSGEIKEIGKNQSAAEQSDEKPDHDVPNWKFG